MYKPCGPKGFFQFEIIINVLASSSIEYLCYGSTTIINSCTLTVRGSNHSAGIDFRRQNQTLTSKVNHCAVRVKYKPWLAHWAHDVVATLNQRHWRWFNVATTSCDQWGFTKALHYITQFKTRSPAIDIPMGTPIQSALLWKRFLERTDCRADWIGH